MKRTRTDCEPNQLRRYAYDQGMRTFGVRQAVRTEARDGTLLFGWMPGGGKSGTAGAEAHNGNASTPPKTLDGPP